MADNRQIVCGNCAAINLLAFERFADQPKCGKCHQPLFQERSFNLNPGNFSLHISKNEIPVLVMFWAAWCGHCQKMRPAFEQAAKQLEPYLRLANVNTESCSASAAQYAISSLPTLILFRNGREVARQPGALTASQVVAWARSKIAI